MKRLPKKHINTLKEVYKKTAIRRYVQLTIGLLLISISFNLFLLPNNIVAGGLTGLSIIVNHYFNFEPVYFLYITSVILLFISYFALGQEVTFYSLFSSLLLPIFIILTKNINLYIRFSSNDILLITLFIGCLLGFGIGLVLKAGFTSGGTDIINKIISKYIKISVNTSMLIVDGLIVFIGSLVFGINNAMYTIIIIYLVSLITDKVLLGISDSKAFYIVTSKKTEVKSYIIKTLNHSVTIFNAEGGYSNQEQNILLCVIPTKEYFKLKIGIKNIDSKAFFVTTDAYEVYGGE
ncbi:MAG: YitT family protein [Tenericutes bacterium]|jgi:uncharacterized membrane-anchored protein YitT (DUF2179 family)|nr:YitT family protein [Mycoplasmatota bacterium]